MGLVALLVVWYRAAIGRVLWRDEDPRTMAAFRIATGACTVAWTLDLWPLVTYLFSDEGLFLGDAARQTIATEAFAGYEEGVGGASATWLPGGLLHFAAGHHFSPLLFWDTPTVAWTLWGLLLISAAALTVGFWTRVTKWATYVLVIALVDRNTIFLAGEQVMLGALFVVCCARCDRAYAIDARGRPLEAIPAWPRVLGVLSTLPLLFVNGVAKTGERWAEGSTLHYVLHNHDFARFDAGWITPTISLYLLRPATWVAHLFELCFPLLVLGTLLRWHRSGATTTTATSPWVRVVWFALAACGLALTFVAFDPAEHVRLSRVVMTAMAIVAATACVCGPWLLRRLPPRLVTGATRWLLGRRLWIPLHLAFTGTLVLVTDLGWFVPLTAAWALLFFDGAELHRALVRLRLTTGAQHDIVPSRWTPPRWVPGWFLAWHLAACLAAGLPHPTETSPWRRQLERPLREWIAFAHTWQSFRMFAPDGPTAAFDAELARIDDDDVATRVDTGPRPGRARVFGWGRDKQRKIAVRLVTHSQTAWYRIWHARWACRDQALRTGVLPTHVRLTRVRRPLPRPRGEPVGAIERTPLASVTCAEQVHGQPRDDQRLRRGVTLPERFEAWDNPRAAKWQERRDRGEVPRWPWVPLVVLGPVAAGWLGARRRRTN